MQRLRELNPKDCEMSVCFELSSCDSSFSPYITGQFASLKKTDLIKNISSDEWWEVSRRPGEANLVECKHVWSSFRTNHDEPSPAKEYKFTPPFGVNKLKDKMRHLMPTRDS